MVPNASDIARRRATALLVVRLMASAIILGAALILAVWTGVALIDASGVEWGVLVVALLIGAVGVGAWACAGPASRLMVRSPGVTTCPICGYRLESLTEPRCTECGTVLTEEFMPGHVSPGSTTSVLGLVAGARLVTSVVVRLLAVPQMLAAMMVMGVSFIRLLEVTRNPNGWYEMQDVYVAWVWIGIGGLWLVLALSMLIFGGLWARWLVSLRAVRGLVPPEGAPSASDPSGLAEHAGRAADGA